MRRLSILLALLTPMASLAQGVTLGSPSVGDAIRTMERLHALHGVGGVGRGPLHQTFVYPERPGQNQVAWYGFDWHYLDVPSPSGGKGGIRLFFYGRERTVAERALPVIRNAYLRLVDQFHYTPTRQIPYILYSSEREFQATNVFQVSEGVLGVTSPRDLKMSLPYFGNHELFREVSTHELVHQFMIQKLLDLASDDGYGSPGDALPLWFVEGIAEYYAKGGLDPESDLFLRDLVWNPDPEQHYEILSFEDDRYRGYIPTYKLGQARIAFIAETYGKERIQSFLENSALAGPGGPSGFAALTRRVLGESVGDVDVRWRAWLRRRYYPEYLRAHEDLTQLREVQNAPAEIEAFEVSPDGSLVLFRGIDREAGRARLYLMDPHFPKRAVEVVSDDQPGVESLHPIERSVMAITRGRIAFAAQSGPGDVLYVQPYRYTPAAGTKPSSIALGDRRQLPVRHPMGGTFLEIADPAFSPDGRELAFVGMTEQGQLDVYVVPSEGGTARRLTDDPYAERDLSWGRDGLYCASDATDHGRFNLFRLDVATGARTRLTTSAWNDAHPRPQPDGSVLFTSNAGGKPDLYLLRDGHTRRITDFVTGLSGPATAPGAHGIWAGTFYRGRFRLVEVPRAAWLEEPAEPVAAADAPPAAIPLDPLPEVVPAYEPYQVGNWRPEAAIVYGGGTTSAFAGRGAVLFDDVLRDRLLYVDVSVYGSFDMTQGIALLQDRSGRNAWSVGLYHWVWGTLDPVNPNLAYMQREFGVSGTLSFPLDRYRRFEVELSAGALQRYCPMDFIVFDTFGVGCTTAPVTATSPAEWERENGGVNPVLGPAVRWAYDTIRFDPWAGPLSGDSLLVELGGRWLPGRDAINGYWRVDAERFWQIIGRSRFMLRGAAAASFAPNDESATWERTWWVSAADNLRGYQPFDLAFLVGTKYYVANAELQFPVDPLLRLAIFQDIMGVAALDFGGVFNNWETAPGATVSDVTRPVRDFGAWDARTLTGVLGVNFIFGPLLLRLHFGHPFDIGGIRTPALRNGDSWVTNFSLRYLFL